MAQIIKVTGDTKQVEPQNGTDFKLKELQEIVGGYIGIAYLSDDEIMVFNEDGKLEGLQLNPKATERYNADVYAFDHIVGDVLICKTSQVK